MDRAKRQLVVACALIAGGLGLAGSIDRTAGGVVLLVGWVAGVAALHRLGRSGADSEGRDEHENGSENGS